MDIEEVLFDIPFPIRIFKKEKVNFKKKSSRNKLFRRNIYHNLYGSKLNPLLGKRWEIFFNLAMKVQDYLIKNFEDLKILSISIFGSSLYSINNGDYDFLVIVKGNKFDNFCIDITLKNKENYFTGISIKGEDNFIKGIIDRKSNFPIDLQNKIIKRTSISLPKRHLPISGFDFKENKEIFLKNCYAQAYDLLNNSYQAYYLKKKENKISSKTRARKLLSRIFEASKYLSFISPSNELEKLKSKILKCQSKRVGLRDSKKIFKEFVEFYNKLLAKRV